METASSRPLAVESFSDSWLSNVRVPSIVNSLEFDESFDFNTPNIAPSPTFVHADELFSDGLIKPNATTANTTIAGDSNSTTVSAMSVVSSTASSEYYSRFKDISGFDNGLDVVDDDVQMGCSYYCCFFRRRRTKSPSSEQICLRKFYEYLRPTTRRLVVGSKKSTKVDDIDRRIMEVRSWSNGIASPQTSPGPSSVCVVDINESSIHEAILHCKRSIGK
ncbi:uncharacterized protein LOC133793708 [Humulus lupulus]|uniref:uncharacterized protein LOC133793708 n=1 Tax=Humulus lupulus TaxID=3486 RepID=UPI002B40DEFE|nr:uncharacterized protein LOC133793708 [Humulus lupulus]